MLTFFQSKNIKPQLKKTSKSANTVDSYFKERQKAMHDRLVKEGHKEADVKTFIEDLCIPDEANEWIKLGCGTGKYTNPLKH